MGVYVFAHVARPYVKVGHYCKNNPWSRVARRGFRSCSHPAALDGRLGVEDLHLVAWFPSLRTTHEKALHRRHRAERARGEWYGADRLPGLLADLDALAARGEVDASARDAALATRRRL